MQLWVSADPELARAIYHARGMRALAVYRALTATGSAVARAFDRILRAARRWWRYRATTDALMELDDRLLKDIGLSRAAIEATAMCVASTGSRHIQTKAPGE